MLENDPLGRGTSCGRVKTSGGGGCDKAGGGKNCAGGGGGGRERGGGDNGGDGKAEVLYLKRHLGVKRRAEPGEPQQVETLKSANLRQAVQLNRSRPGLH